MEQEEFTVDPQQLQVEARKEQPRRGLDEYGETIRVLREEKGFSFREIAAWLRERGVNVDHNAVWRTHSRPTQRGPVSSPVERPERVEQVRVHDEAMPWLKEA